MGIFAQNVGGGGGNGAVGLNGSVSTGGGKTLTIALGASGGSGGEGGTVVIDNSGAITTGLVDTFVDTSISQAYGLFGQSVGGGGGAGMLTGSVVYGKTSESGTNHGIAMALGGTAGGGSGGGVKLLNAGAVTTNNHSSHAMFAQSVGGGGGVASDLGGISTADSSDQWEVAVDVGGSGAGAGNGGAVTLDNTAVLETWGDGAYGAFAQSIGGGGGSAANGAGLSSFATKNANLAINVGGKDGTSGNGGNVAVSSNSVTTNGIGSIALLAQSVGAGGGEGGSGAGGVSGTVTLGGSGSSSGNGGTVIVTTSNSSIQTTSTDSGSVTGSHGIVAQSIGGGGGYAGTILMGASSYFGSGLDMGNGTATKGDGGDVTLELNGGGSTLGGSSVAVLAQSVGGGGGVRGFPGGAAFIGSGGGSGVAGIVSVSYSPGSGGGSIRTSGVGSHGIFAQSAGGAGTTQVSSVKTSVNAMGDILVAGAGAHGIYAQSSGNGMGAIDVTVATGATVQGGAEATVSGAEDGAGVFIKEGSASTLSNSGTISSVNGTGGIAVNATATKLTIVNHGTIVGQICKGGSCNPGEDAPGSSPTTIETRNERDGLLVMGSRHESDRLINAGTVDIGGAGIFATALHRGDFRHSASGRLAMDLDAENNIADRLDVEGEAELAGSLAVRMGATGSAQATQRVTVLTSHGDLSAESINNFNVASSAVVDYELLYPVAGQVDLEYRVDYSNRRVQDASNDNQQQASEYLERLFVEAPLGGALASLVDINDMTAYLSALDSLGGQAYADNLLSSLYSSLAFGDALLSCAQRDGDYRVIREGQCGWLRAEGRVLERDDTDDSVGFDSSSMQIAGGGQAALDNDWHLGGALSYEQRNLDQNQGLGDSNGYQLQLGAVAKKQMGATMLSGSLSFGYADFDVKRNVYGGGQAKADQTLWTSSVQFRAAYLFDRDSWYLKPMVDLGVDYLSSGKLSEEQAAALNLSVKASDDTYVYIQPALELGAESELKNGILLRPNVRVGVTRFLTNSDPSVEMSFTSSSSEIAGFDSASELDRSYLDVNLGLDLLTNKGWVLSVDGSGQFSENLKSYGGSVKLAIPF